MRAEEGEADFSLAVSAPDDGASGTKRRPRDEDIGKGMK